MTTIQKINYPRCGKDSIKPYSTLQKKHFDMTSLRETSDKRQIIKFHMPTEKIADVMTKGLPGNKHRLFVKGLRLVPDRECSLSRN